RSLDVGRFGQVVANLIENALRHAAASVVEVRVERADGEDRVAVIDDGRGLGDEDLRHAFEAFYHGREAGPGVGLGLTVARELVEAHGGTIAAANGAGGGATFTIRLPLTAAAVPAC